MDQTRELLVRWHGGDAKAMAQLVEQEREFVQTQVRARLGSQLRRSADTQDVVQETMLHVLRNAPRFLLSDRSHFRALLLRMVENRLSSLAARQQRQKRDLRREQSLPQAGELEVLDLDRAADATDPADAVARDDVRGWVRLALEVLDPEDRDVLVMRNYHNLGFEQIAAELGKENDAVRMRYRRALPKLARALSQLKAGRLDDLL